ncbi:Uncharacterised protein [Vibrio cholerae]|nr:Uncharacterised protein [Vibrio cholerae]
MLAFKLVIKRQQKVVHTSHFHLEAIILAFRFFLF